MKKILPLVLLAGLLISTLSVGQGTRYLDEVFDDVVTVHDQLYSVNVTVVTGVPAADSLYFDLYMPDGDTCTARPLVVVLHTGTFLPKGFVATTGDKDDYANVRICQMLARRGYVVASVQYRKGWNPIAPTDIERRATIINAAYRSIQDLYAFLRFMNRTVDDFGNPYRLDTDRVALFGVGTGAFVGFNAAVLTQAEIYIDKFRNPVTGESFVDTNLVGDLHGINPGIINIPNHVGYKDDFHFAFGLDGGVGDSSWIEMGPPPVPIVCAGVVSHPTTPFGVDPITGELNCDLPVFAGAGTGIFVVNIAGSLCMVTKTNELGFNDPLNTMPYDDPISEALRGNDNNFGQEHLWAINLPGAQTGPWEYWDAAFWSMVPHPLNPMISLHDAGLATNPDMSMEKANAHIDTAVWFFAPRAYAALSLGDVVCVDPCAGIQPDFSVVDDFECQRNYSFGAGADRLSLMMNPQPDSENQSEYVGVYADPPNDPWAALCIEFPDGVDLETFRYFDLQIWSPIEAPILFKLEGGSSPAYEMWQDIGITESWHTLRADFGSQQGEHHTRICLFLNGGVEEPEEYTFYLDNLRLEMESRVFTPTVEKLQISPNPVHHLLHVANPGEASVLRMTNILGQHVRTTHVTPGAELISVYVGDLLQGVYILGAYDVHGRLIASARIIKE